MISQDPPSKVRVEVFATTRWVMVVMAGNGAGESARSSLDFLCRDDEALEAFSSGPARRVWAGMRPRRKQAPRRPPSTPKPSSAPPPKSSAASSGATPLPPTASSTPSAANGFAEGDGGVRLWLWFITLELGPEFLAWFDKENPFHLIPALHNPKATLWIIHDPATNRRTPPTTEPALPPVQADP